ncbi:DUF6345 domain-containing protein [Paracoccus sp. MBLB3053]|uniref:DUF6345 domain-containing protein n=1 Tax=Paracoccus aurantius TaxID=3073814 RepID=A0ABU2HSL5_9RHOB|nr:DUF6345 domain-containing protein [Paracoccus sp. MBLB3053]MDS9468040.1 DUF6345 domain-containing protein [Paracoccus sp. MBLB3053]
MTHQSLGMATVKSPSAILFPTLGSLSERSDPAEPGVGLTEPIYGACSAETYRAAGALHAAHRDAGGFLDQVDRYATPDFWRRDGAVKSWLYSRDENDIQADQDIDAVRVFYHAGHGAMEPSGSFRLPMGALSNGSDACQSSELMSFGADRLRYLFWSASQSLRVADGHTPLRSWAKANRGLRMMFGFDSVEWDSSDQGDLFWRHWRMGKSFSQSWLDAAADVSQEQIPTVCAMGETQDEALANLYGENRFMSGRAKCDWWAWRWNLPLSQQRREPLSQLPAMFPRIRLVHADNDHALAAEVLKRMGAGIHLLEPVPRGMSISFGDMRFSRSETGSILLEFGRQSRGAGKSPNLQRRPLISQARAALRHHGFVLPRQSDHCFDRILLSMSAGRSLSGSGKLPETIDEIIVQFRQTIENMPVISADAGYLRVVFRADGSLLRIESTLRQVAGIRPAIAAGVIGDSEVPQLLAQSAARLLRDLAARGAAPLSLRAMPGLTEIGYGIRSNTARLIAREAVEVTCARGFRKCYWIESDLGD